ncbi:hypothetical protein [Labilibaculum manganireducens]|uniref:hypothetical protein n=1 Tax=Labilibaculum manganireducens TaxID=1940525 RepID=UPI0029F54F63|nr:hypothetical protein [Labilibaculum manganireducens]
MKEVGKYNVDKLEIKYIEQRHEGLEAWVRRAKSDWIRLDFMLEYYLFGNVNLSKEYKSQLIEKMKAKQYYELFYDKFIQAIKNGRKFDFQEYIDWQRCNRSEIDEVLKLLHNPL